MKHLRSTVLVLSLALACTACGKANTPSAADTGSGKTVESKETLMANAAEGDADAAFQLGALFHDGEGVPKDNAKAIEWFEKAATLGDSRAQFNLGVMYYSGDGVKQDYAKARSWFEKAAAQKNIRAEFNLGVMYYRAEGVKQDFAKAMDLFTQSGMQNFPDAQFNIGVMYAKGEGVKSDITKAYSWFSIARDNGNPSANEVMLNIERQLSPEQLTLVKKAAADLKTEILKNKPAGAM